MGAHDSGPDDVALATDQDDKVQLTDNGPSELDGPQDDVPQDPGAVVAGDVAEDDEDLAVGEATP